MLNEETARFLRTLKYRADSKRQISILPLGSIYWDDELPKLGTLGVFAEPEWNEVVRAFAIRMKLWDHQVLEDSDREFWEALQSAAPDWALFRRLELSEEDRKARVEAEENCAKEMQELLASADEVTFVTEQNGLQCFSATFHLDKGRPRSCNSQPWWKRLIRLPKWLGGR